MMHNNTGESKNKNTTTRQDNNAKNRRRIAKLSSGMQNSTEDEQSGIQNTTEDERKGQLRSMDAAAGIFSYVHISKYNGLIWVTLLKHLKLTVFPQRRSGYQELSVYYQRTKLGNKTTYHLTTLRSPRHHVFSMFLHCKYYQKNNQINQWQWKGTTDEARQLVGESPN